MELLERWLPIESDLQAFLAAAGEAAEQLGASRLERAPTLLRLSERLRHAGAGRGYPLRARLRLHGPELVAEWGEVGHALPVTRTAGPAPSPEAAERLRERLGQRFAHQDPEALRQRNEQMSAQLAANREQMEAELRDLQEALERRQRELTRTLLEAETDPLTGAKNRRAFNQAGPQAFRRTQRQQTEPLSVLLVDLDHFKAVNDSYGHQYGDDYLQWATAQMGAAIRSEVDTLFRIGGDEFAILLFADAQAACARALEILEGLEGQASIGVATLAPGDSGEGGFEQLLEAADRALYEVKESGRGQVAHADCRQREGAACPRPGGEALLPCASGAG